VSNTKARILSALIMAILVVLAIYFGKWTSLLAILIVGVLCIDEILINFAHLKRSNFIYKYVIGFFSLFFIAVNAYQARLSLGFFTIASLFLNLFLIYYLFKIPIESGFMKKSAAKNPGLISFLVILPLLSFGIHFDSYEWQKMFILLLLVTYAMDTGAWFFGKNFGKHKLWPVVSPKKTIEGLFGGMFVSALCASIFWNALFPTFAWYYALIFALCGLISQVGDLVQSKLKREFEIKDSSNLIPGHGGVYDRIDSLIFLSPFFVIVVKYLG
jgi:phosphatidate cytidylyltransferase